MATLRTSPWTLSRRASFARCWTFHHVQTNSRYFFRPISTRPGSDAPSYVHRQLTINTEHNKDTPDQEFFNGLKRLLPSKEQWESIWMKQKHATEQCMALIVLFTPDFIPWFKDDAFIPKMLQQISHTSSNGVPFAYEVLFACVDGIAPEERLGTFHGQPVTKGFSFLHGTAYSIFGNSPNCLEDRDQPSSSTQASLVVYGAHQGHLSHVGVPLANTIFQTGKQSMLIYSRWKAQDGAFVEVKERSAKSFVYIHVFRSEHHPFTYIPARPVTDFRVIEAGLGNIVRSLNFGEDDIGPASRELETVVAEISESQGGSKVDVWALLVPQGIIGAVAEELPGTDPEYVGFWLSKGATLCRVVSGGGGWGPKQGLLSLDPQTEFKSGNKVSDVDDESLEQKTFSTLRDLAQVGSSIQFLVVDNGQTFPGKVRQRRNWRQSTVFGTMRSTIDDIPKAADESQSTQYRFRAGHFGCVSGSGIFYTTIPGMKPRPKSQGTSEVKPDPKAIDMVNSQDGSEQTVASSPAKHIQGNNIKDDGESEVENDTSSLEDGSKSEDARDVDPEADSESRNTKIDLPGSYIYIDYRYLELEGEASQEEVKIRKITSSLSVRKIKC